MTKDKPTTIVLAVAPANCKAALVQKACMVTAAVAAATATMMGVGAGLVPARETRMAKTLYDPPLDGMTKKQRRKTLSPWYRTEACGT